jgi:hypothetical protein
MSLAKATAGVTALGIACSVSQCAGPAHGATITRQDWQIAARREREAWAAVSEHSAAAKGKPFNRADREADEQRFAEIVHAHSVAYVAMLNTPAPDAAALVWKLDRIKEQDGYGLSWGDEGGCFDALNADIRRLVKEA